MNFLSRLGDYFLRDAGMKPFKSATENSLKAKTPPLYVEPPEALVKRCYDLMMKHMHGLDHAAKTVDLWKPIPKVKCPVAFGGWGFVEGRTNGAVINKSITIFECDDDMDFTEYTVLINTVPAMTVYHGRYGTYANIIDGKDYFAQVFGEGNLHFDTWEKFSRLPAPVKTVLTDIAIALFKNRVTDDVGPEALLNYHFTRR